MSFTTLIWEDGCVKPLDVDSSTVDLALNVQIVAFMTLMRERKISPFRGCYWHFRFDDYYAVHDLGLATERRLPHYRLRAFAEGSELGGSLAQVVVGKCDDLNEACARVIDRFCQERDKVPTGSYWGNTWLSLCALDAVPWEIHKIRDYSAYENALAAYRENCL